MERRTVWGVVIAVGVVLLLVAFALFRPDKLFVDEVVEEELDADVAAALDATTTAPPTTASDPTVDDDPAATTAPPTTATPVGPVVVAAGSWISLGRYTTSGEVAVIEDGDTATLVFNELATDNGPDLFVYLSPADAVDGEQLPEGSLNLGGLRGNIGTQTYEIPAGTDLSQYASVVIWCERFSSAFGAAQLDPA
jgi:hypothetical protein